MSTISLTVTEFSRGSLDFLNQVQYQGQTLDIRRGKRVVARVLPAAAPSGYPLERLDDFLLKGPQISEDVGALRSNLLKRDCS
ncbi:hypothetical protein HC248_00282 [Polaromonas vacuolata]|uniref:Uncharacterized protein n=1 Tax=Polaromonas vacuolata TaxID=37448 RepID=A0A6H2H590_9BURK|nr:hypothetical protein [Polaromonas vacuolata]QJC55019.1 hypothetical protein HC248_00282 [Polaromonas vacuolata]